MKDVIYKMNIGIIESQSDFFSKSNFQIENFRDFQRFIIYIQSFLKSLKNLFLNYFISVEKQKFDYLYSIL